jgi:ketosteroid isomerase-like protein
MEPRPGNGKPSRIANGRLPFSLCSAWALVACPHRGTDAYRRSWEAMFPYLPPRLGSEIRDLSITASGDVAFMCCLQRLINEETKEA